MIFLDNQAVLIRGSLHTYGTANKYNETTIDEFCDRIISQKIKVIGLTNYFHISEKEFSEIKNGLESHCYVIPNFEFRSSDKNNKGQYINFHILFNPDLEFRSILKPLNGVKLYNYQDKTCNYEDIQKLGLESVTVDFEYTIGELRNHFKVIDDFIVISAYNGYGGFKNDSKPKNVIGEKKYDINSHGIFANNSYKKYFLKPREYKIGGNDEIIETEKPVLECSDAHTEKDIGEKYTWIKADPNFDGLKQIIFEPEQRVKIQNEKPDQKEEKLIIDHVKFLSPDSKFTTEEIHFNDNLNVIIGGKSSGKSILLYNIARTLVNEKNENSVLRYKNPDNGNFEFKYDFEKEFNFEVTLKSGVKQTLRRDEDNPSILPEVKYIPQNYLAELAERKFKKNNELNKLVRDLLLEDPVYQVEYDSFITKVKRNDVKRESQINNLFELRNKVLELKSSLRDLGNESALKGNIELTEEKIGELKRSLGLSPEEIEEYDRLNSKLEIANFEKTKILNDFRRISNYNSSLISDLQELKSKKDLTINSIENELIKEHYKQEYADLDRFLEKANQINSLLATDQNFNFLNKNFIGVQVEQIDKAIEGIKESLKPFLKEEALKKKIKELEKSILADSMRPTNYIF